MFNRETYCKSSIDLLARRQIKHISQSAHEHTVQKQGDVYNNSKGLSVMQEVFV